MTDRPILFSAPMVRALLDGTKSQTRRILKDVPPSPGDDALNPARQIRHEHAYLDAYCSANRTPLNPRGMSSKWCWWTRDDRQCLPTFNVRFAPGDQLYVRETFSFDHSWKGAKPSEVIPAAPVHYWADGNPFDGDWTRPIPGIHMPRWASRLTLTVTDVRVQRVQRLQECSGADAIAEGISRDAEGWWLCRGADPKGDILTSSPQDAYRLLWEQINGAGSWETNPFVVAVSFSVTKANIDTARAA